MTRFWHPFANMADINAQGEVVLERASGAHVWDVEGRRYLDAAAGLWYCNVGYGREEIAEACAAQIRAIPAYSAFGEYATKPTIELADRLVELAPTRDSVVFFTCNGSDAVDSAIKLVRHYWVAKGQPDRSTIVVRQSAYHGMHVGGTGIAGIPENRAGYGPLDTGVATVSAMSPGDLAETIDRLGAGRVAAFFCEPVLGAGGVYPPAPGYLVEVERVCRERGVLFVVDEVITGFGRLGDWFASNRFGLTPDLLLCAKGLTSGYVPMGAVLVGPEVASPFWGDGAEMWRHGYTYSGHAVSAAAALANLAIMERESLPRRALELEKELEAALAPVGRHPLVSEVRGGTGVLAAVQLDAEARRERPQLPAVVVRQLRRAGVLTRSLTGGAIQVSPALVLDDEDQETLAGALLEALDAAV